MSIIGNDFSCEIARLRNFPFVQISWLGIAIWMLLMDNMVIFGKRMMNSVFSEFVGFRVHLEESVMNTQWNKSRRATCSDI